MFILIKVPTIFSFEFRYFHRVFWELCVFWLATDSPHQWPWITVRRRQLESELAARTGTPHCCCCFSVAFSRHKWLEAEWPGSITSYLLTLEVPTSIQGAHRESKCIQNNAYMPGIMTPPGTTLTCVAVAFCFLNLSAGHVLYLSIFI